MKKTLTIGLALAGLLSLTACSEDAGSIEVGDTKVTITDPDTGEVLEETTLAQMTKEQEEYDAAQTSDDVLFWATTTMVAPDDLEVIEDGVAVSESEQTIYALSCARAAELTEEEGAEYGPRWEGDEAVMGYATVCRD